MNRVPGLAGARAALVLLLAFHGCGESRGQTAGGTSGEAAADGGSGAEAARQAQAPELARGRQLYEEQCAICHGSDGRGDGPAAYLLFPAPRDFTRAYFKVRSTASGSIPTDEDLFRTITRGMPGSAMPAFEWLAEADRRALVEVVKGFSDAFATLAPEPLPAPPPPPEADPATLALGAEKYGELGCGRCHGEEGRGDGPSAAELRDYRERPIRPNDFTRGIYKGGGTPRDIYMRFATGMDGTPMPSYEGTATPAEMWALAHYVKALAGEKVAVQPTTGRLVARRTEAPAPSSPEDPRWEAAASFRVPVMLLWQRQEAVEAVDVRALHDGDALVLLLTWEDPTAAWSSLRGEDFSDAVAVQFGLSRPPPHFAMGSGAGRVNIWQWRADLQLEAARRRALTAVYPTAVSDAPAGFPGFNPAAEAGNAWAGPEPPSVVQDLNAAGLGTVTPQPPRDQNVTGSGVWAEGWWRVVLRRSLRSSDPGDVSLAPGEVVPVAFAVWDGDREDRDGQKAVTTWYELEIGR